MIFKYSYEMIQSYKKVWRKNGLHPNNIKAYMFKRM